MSYWDSSALAKLYLKEPDSAVFLSLAKRAVPLRTSPLGQFEITLTLRRQEAEGFLDRPTADTLADELLVDIASGLVELVASQFDLQAEFQHVVQTCFRRTSPISIRTRPSPIRSSVEIWVRAYHTARSNAGERRSCLASAGLGYSMR